MSAVISEGLKVKTLFNQLTIMDVGSLRNPHFSNMIREGKHVFLNPQSQLLFLVVLPDFKCMIRRSLTSTKGSRISKRFKVCFSANFGSELKLFFLKA